MIEANWIVCELKSNQIMKFMLIPSPSVNAKWTRTKCMIFFFSPDQKNQENLARIYLESVNTP